MNDRELVRALKALADPTRFRMVQEIAAAGELSCGEIVELFPLSQPTISHHLKILTDAGIVTMRPEAKHHFISVNHDVLASVAALLPLRIQPKKSAPRREPAKRARRA